MIKKILILSGYLLLLAFFAVTFSFTSKEGSNIVCSRIEIETGKNEPISLKREEIARLVKAADKKLIGKSMDEINAELIEKEIEKNPAILKADVYKITAKDSTKYTGILGVKVKHRKPVLRVITGTGGYYLDKYGERIPVSSSYTARVLVITGQVNEKLAKTELLPFVLDLENDDFWKAQIKQLHVNQEGDVLIIPMIGDHLVELGSVENYPEKLRNMKAFYKQVMANNNWNTYKSVSLKYKNQIIAKRKS